MAADDIDMDEHIRLSEELDKLETEKRELEKELLKEVDEFHQAVKDSLSELNIFGFDILGIIGGEIESTAKSLEEEIAGICIALEDFKMNWHKKILFAWVKIIKKFVSAIGLGAIFDFMFLTWCDFLKIIGMPMGINVSLPSIAGVISTVVSATKSDEGGTTDRGSDEGISFAYGDGVKTEFDLPAGGSGAARIFIDGKEDEMIMEDGSNLLLESVENVNSLGELPDTILLESTEGTSIVGNKIIFDTAPVDGVAVSIIKIAA